ncbi:MAG: TolC family protein, partial [Oceanobacter sp.]
QSYRETLLTAVQEVTDALALDQSLQRQIEERQQALDSARRNEARYLARYRSGLATLLELLSVQQSRYDLEAQLNSLTYERLNNRIQLGLALGWPAQALGSSSQVTSQVTSQVLLQDSSQPESQSASKSASHVQLLSQTSPQGES